MAKQFFVDIDLQGNRLLNSGFQQLAAAPATPFAGQLYEDISALPSVLKRWNGTAWLALDNAPTNGFTLKGAIDASTNPAFPAAPSNGDTYLISVGGTVGGTVVEVGDILYRLNGGWTVVQNNLQAASQAQAGYIRIATQIETNTGTDDATAVSPLKLATFFTTQSTARKGFALITGDGVTSSFVLTHTLATQDLIAQLRGVTSQQVVEADITMTSATSVTVGFAAPPAAGLQYRLTLVG